MASNLAVVQSDDPTPLQNLAGGESPSGGEGSEPPHMAGMLERLAKLEAAMEGLRHSQNLALGAVVGFGAIIATLVVYGFTRVDQLSDRIAAIPGQVAAENRDIVKTLSDAITATKQQQPQVILLPAPQPQPLPAPIPQNPK